MVTHGAAPDPARAALETLVGQISPAVVQAYDWSSARWDPLEVEVAYYPSERLPPRELITSVRAVVFRARSVLVVTNRKGEPAVCPGGHRFECETLDQTVRRELLEESGWHLGALSRLGFMRVTTTSPRPPDFPYPFPHAVWQLYLADALRYDAAAHTGDPDVVSAEFVEIGHARELPMDRLQRALLAHAIRARRAAGAAVAR